MVRWHPLEDVGGTASTLAAGDRRCRPPRPLHACRGTTHPSQLAYIDANPLSLSTDQVPANAAGNSITHTVRPVAQGFSQTGSVDTHTKETRVAATRPAAWPGTGAPYWGARSPSTAVPPPPHLRSGRTPLGAAMPQAHTLGGSRADPPLLPQHP